MPSTPGTTSTKFEWPWCEAMTNDVISGYDEEDPVQYFSCPHHARFVRDGRPVCGKHRNVENIRWQPQAEPQVLPPADAETLERFARIQGALLRLGQLGVPETALEPIRQYADSLIPQVDPKEQGR